MPPPSNRARNWRMALRPILWIVAISVVYVVYRCMVLIADHPSGKMLEKTESLWPLAVFVPAWFLGKVLGAMAMNLVSYSIPSLREIFLADCAATGRPGYGQAMIALSKAAALMSALTLLGIFVFKWTRS